MEQERLQKAFNIKSQMRQETPSDSSADPRMQMAKQLLDNRETGDISNLLEEIANDIDSGKKGTASEKIKRAEKIAQKIDIPRYEWEELKQLEDML